MAFYYDSHIVPDAAWRPAQDAGCAGRPKILHLAGRVRQTGEALVAYHDDLLCILLKK